MSIIQGNAKQASTRGFYSFPIEQSLRFNDDDSAYLSYRMSAGDQKTMTFSFWVKRCSLGASQAIFCRRNSSNSEHFLITFLSDDTFRMRSTTGGSLVGEAITDAVFRDTSAWYHIVCNLDAANTSAEIYVNGVLATLSTDTTFQNVNHQVNADNVIFEIGRRPNAEDQLLDAYLAEVNFIDGTALDASSFGELKNGVWIPKDPSELTYGTNGFRLSFADDAEVEAFNTVLWRGNGLSSSSVTGMGFEPDLVWIKARDGAYNHILFDSVRGVGKYLTSSQTFAENWAGNLFPNSKPTTDGFIVDGHLNVSINESGKKYVAWGWKAGGAPTVDNSAGEGNVPTAGSVKIDGVNSTSALAGSLPATRLSASTTYGFSIVSYSGSGGNATIAHELGVAPSMIMFKNLTTDRYWLVHHKDISLGPSSELQYLILNQSTGAEGMGAVNPFMQGTLPTSTEFYVHNNLGYNSSSNNYIAYCWAEKSGYSKFGSYEGSNSAVSVTGFGFTPAFVLIKAADTAQSWVIFDNTRDVSEPQTFVLFPDGSFAEESNPTNRSISFTSDGFTVNSTNAFINGSGNGTFIYAAFADTREAAFWLDQSGNDNDWQPVNLDHNDTVADSPTDNFATLNPLQVATSGAPTFADGNLEVTTPVSGSGIALSTIGVTSGKYYAEVTPVSINSLQRSIVGITGDADATITANTNIGSLTSSLDVGYFYNGTKFVGNVETSGYGASYDVGDVIGIALNVDDSEVTFYKNGVSQGAISFTSGGTYHFAYCDGSAGAGGTARVNFGQQPFKYDPPA